MEVVHPRSLLSVRRFDIPVKYRYFRHLACVEDDPAAEQLYLWHIDRRRNQGLRDEGKETAEDYVSAAVNLYTNMSAKGYDDKFPIPVDPHGEILGGAHRLACALLLNLDVPIQRCQQEAWAPSWSFRWFCFHQVHPEDRIRMVNDWEYLWGLHKEGVDNAKSDSSAGSTAQTEAGSPDTS